MGLAAGPGFYGYPENPLAATGPLGLSETCGITTGKNFKDHYISKYKILGKALGTKFPSWSKSANGLEFRKALQQLIESGKLQHAGMATTNKGADPVHVFEGMGLKVLIKPGGEFFTLLESGTGRASPGSMQFVSDAVPGLLPW